MFLADPEVGLRPAAIWHIEDAARFATFRAITEATTLARGESLGGRVLATGAPLWLPDVIADDDFAQARISAELGVRAGFAFPLLVGEEVVGVMEFFSAEIREPDERLLALLAQVGTALGRALERDRALAAERLLHRELAVRAAELERSNSDLSDFASIASHDLQEPLRKVRMFNERVVEMEAEALSEQGRDYLRRSNSAAARMQTLIEDLLAFSRVTSCGGEFAHVELGEVTGGVLDDLEAAVQRCGATVRVGRLPAVAADPTQMRQVIQNLLANALKFTREGVPPEVLVDGAVSAGVATITVRDNGIGFEPRYRERIFRVFERLHGRMEYEGTGIGLALCRKIVERHGGEMTADGEPGAGATFTVTIPVVHAAAA